MPSPLGTGGSASAAPGGRAEDERARARWLAPVFTPTPPQVAARRECSGPREVQLCNCLPPLRGVCVCVCVEILHLPPLLYNFPAAVRPGTRYSQKAAIHLAKLGDNRSCSCLVPLFWLGSGLSCKTNIFPVFPLVSQGKFALISHHLGTMLPRPCGNISVTISHCTTTSSIKGSIFLAQRSTFLCCLSFSAFLHLLTSLSEGSQLFNCMSHCSGMISGGLYIRAKDNN